MQEQVSKDFPRILNKIANIVIRRVKAIVGNLDYYWTLHQSEWATDLMFNSVESLEQIYPRLVRGSFISFSSEDIMRYLGKKLHGNYKGSKKSGARSQNSVGFSLKNAVTYIAGY